MAAAAIFAKKTGLPKLTSHVLGLRNLKKAAKSDSKAIVDFVPHPKPNYKATSWKITEQDKEFFHRKLANPEVTCLIEDILNIFLLDKAAFIEKYKISSRQIACLALRTVGQQSSQLWGWGGGGIWKTSSDRK